MDSPADDSQKRYAPATLRNRLPIEAVLRDIVPETGNVLEIASGSGEHAVHFAGAFPDVFWQPSDVDPACIASIRAWLAEAKLPNLRAPLWLDATAPSWPNITSESIDGVVSINMIHISPWSSCQGLMKGAAAVLRAGGFLLLYGPFKQNGRHTANSNKSFDDHLREMDPRFGVRDIADVVSEAETHGLRLTKQRDMPANNQSLIFRN